MQIADLVQGSIFIAEYWRCPEIGTVIVVLILFVNISCVIWIAHFGISVAIESMVACE